MGRSNEEFTVLIKKIVEEEVPSLVAAGYQTAQARSIEKIGEQLKLVYTQVLEEEILP